MFNRVLFTIATAACLTGVYAVYAVTTRPLVVVPGLPETDVEPTQHGAAHRPQESVRIAETYLSEQHWAAQSEYMLRAGQSFIYTKQWKPQPGNQWIEFAPFAMVWLQKDKQGREQAVSLVSDSAQLKFSTAFDELNPNPGRVVGAVLDGEVQIKGPDGLMIGGKRFVFDESAPSLVSTNPVQFQYGSHNGQGRSLHMKLIPAEGLPGRDRPHVYGIRTIRLGSGMDPETKKFEPVRLDLRIPQQGKQKLIQVQCQRDLEYDVETQTATFSKNVRAYSWTGPQYDVLDCDELWVQFERAKSSKPVTVQPSDEKQATPRSFQHIDTDLAFRRMIALGQKVTVQSTQNKLRATMNRLEYDAVEHRLQMTDPRQVYVDFGDTKQGKTILAVPDVQVWLHDDNSLKELLCKGQGRLEMTRSGTSDLAFVATWARQLRKSTDPETGLDYVELQRQALFRQPSQQTGLGAELIKLWLAPLAINLPGTSDKSSPAPLPEPHPKRLVAERDVALISPKLVARTNELEVQFDEETGPPRLLGLESRDGLEQVSYEEKGAAKPVQRQRAAQTPIKTRASRGAVLGRVQPASSVTAEPGSLGPPIEIPTSNDVKSTEPLDVSADRITVRMRRIPDQDDPELVEVETKGRVKVIQRRTGGAPFTAEGDRMRLQNRGDLREIVDLFGQPAHLRDRGLHVEGREVHLDREENMVSVKGAGLLQLPVPPETIQRLQSIWGQGTNDPDLDVWWNESMVFDGRVAKFIGKVRAELGLSRMRCDQMDVSLSSRLSFADTESDQKAELGTIHCREDVSFENSAYEGSRLIHVQRGHVAELILDSVKETSFAQGPGQILVWNRSKGNQAGLAPRDTIQANRPINSVTADWDFTHVNFKGRMNGKIDQQRSTFHNSVMIVHGPVERPSATIDPDHLPAQAGSMRCNNLECTYKSKTDGQPKDYYQLVGIGNSRIEGPGFYANADEISFDGSKDLYMLRAYGNQTAMIAIDSDSPLLPDNIRQPKVRNGRHETVGRRIDFNPVTKTVKVDWSSGATGSQ